MSTPKQKGVSSTHTPAPGLTQAFNFLEMGSKPLLRVNDGVSIEEAARYLCLILESVRVIQLNLASGAYEAEPHNCQELNASLYLTELALGIAGGMGGCN